MNDVFKEMLTWGLGGGAIGSVLTWLFNRPKQKNDFLAELQASINLLSTEYRKQIELNTELNKTVLIVKSELEKVRSENKKLLDGQEELKRENTALREEVSNLREQLNGIKTITRTK